MESEKGVKEMCLEKGWKVDRRRLSPSLSNSEHQRFHHTKLCRASIAILQEAGGGGGYLRLGQSGMAP